MLLQVPTPHPYLGVHLGLGSRMGRNDRPEHTAPPEIFYNEDEARKYTDNTRMISIQTSLTERALELLSLPQDGTPKLLLDLAAARG